MQSTTVTSPSMHASKRKEKQKQIIAIAAVVTHENEQMEKKNRNNNNNNFSCRQNEKLSRTILTVHKYYLKKYQP